MTEHIPDLPPPFGEAVFEVVVRTNPGPAISNVPELQLLAGIELDVNNPGLDGLELGKQTIYAGPDLWRALYTMEQVQLPLIGFGLFNFGWRVIATRFDVTDLIPRTIDVLDFIMQLVRETFAKTGSPINLSPDSLSLESLVNENCGDVLTDDAGYTLLYPTPALWYQMVVDRKLTIRGNQFPISDEQHRILTGEVPRFEDVEDWAALLLQNGSTSAVAMEDFAANEPLLRTLYYPYFAPYENPIRLEENDFFPRRR